MVAQAWLDHADAPEVLEFHGRSPIVRGIRHKPALRHGRTWWSLALRDRWAILRFGAALRCSGCTSCHMTSRTPWWHLGEARALADEFPDTQIILNHTGLPSDRSPEGLAGWRKAMGELAGASNVALKISGLGEAGQPWSANDNRSVVLDAIDIFGPERVMFASNFPVDSLVGSFKSIFLGFVAITSTFSVEARDAMFRRNAARLYRFPDEALI